MYWEKCRQRLSVAGEVWQTLRDVAEQGTSEGCI